MKVKISTDKHGLDKEIECERFIYVAHEKHTDGEKENGYIGIGTLTPISSLDVLYSMRVMGCYVLRENKHLTIDDLFKDLKTLLAEDMKRLQDTVH